MATVNSNYPKYIYIMEYGDNDWTKLDAVYPLSTHNKLAELLDSGAVTVRNSREKPYEHGGYIKIKAYEREADDWIHEEFIYLLDFDDVIQKRKVEPYVYEHNISLIELTKLLEGVTCPSMCFKQPRSGEPKYTLKSIMEEIIRTSPLRTKSETLIIEAFASNYYFKLDPGIYSKFNVAAPELSFNSPTMWEALLEIGKYVQCVPRVCIDQYAPLWVSLGDTLYITFDDLGKTEAVANSSLIHHHYGSTRHSDQYCTELDTTAENLIDENNDKQSSIVYPYKNGWITPRCSEGIEISNDYAELVLPYNIDQIISIKVSNFWYNNMAGFTFLISPSDSADYKYIDITDYILEKRNWDTLEDKYSSSLATATKRNRLYFERGSNVIPISNTYETWLGLSHNTIRNIITDAARSVVGELNRLLDVLFKNLLFQIEYIPLSNARLKTVRTNIDDYKRPFTLFNNQSENVTSANHYGRSQQGLIDRMGGIVTEKEFRVLKYADIPKVGQLHGDRYVSEVAIDFRINGYKALVQYSKDYNRLSELIRVDKQRRSWEIPADVTAVKMLHFQEFIEVSTEAPAWEYKKTSHITANGMKVFMSVFVQSSRLIVDGNFVTDVEINIASCDTGEKTIISTISRAFGNSLAFSLEFKDNYSAGLKSMYADPYKNEARDVEYSINGAFSELGVQLGYMGASFGILDETAAVALANSLPSVSDLTIDALFDYTGLEAFYISKDVGETIGLTIQHHIVSKESDIIIGPALAKYNPLVNGLDITKASYIYGLNRTIGRYEQYITDGIQIGLSRPSASVSDDEDYVCLASELNNTGTAFSSYYIATDDDGEVLLAVNKPVANAEYTDNIFFTFTRERS